MPEENKNLEEQKRKSSWTLLRKIGVGMISLCIITGGLSIWGLGEASGESWGIVFFLFLFFVDTPLFILGIILILIDLFQRERKKEKELKKELKRKAEIQRKIAGSRVKRVILTLSILFLIWLVSGIFPPPFSLSFYLYQAALKTKSSFFCFISPFAFNFGREQCYLDLAVEKKDLSLCDKTDSQYYCYQRVAEITKDASICKELPLGFSDDCYRDIAEARKEPSLCAKITNSEKKDYCYKIIARTKKDPSFCEKIMDSWKKDNCYYDIAVFEKKDSTICGEIFRENLRERCIEKIGNQTTNWKTYRNEEYGYEIKYPKDWYFLKDACCPPPPTGITLNNYSDEKSELSKHQLEEGVFTFNVLCLYEGKLDEIGEVKLLKEGGTKYEYLTINEAEAIKFRKNKLLTYYIANGTSSCRVIFSNDCEPCKQILSTFRFLK